VGEIDESGLVGLRGGGAEAVVLDLATSQVTGLAR
jgi:hypothetical protein